MQGNEDRLRRDYEGPREAAVQQVGPNSISDDVLVDLVTQDVVIGLVDLDDLLDATVNVVGKEGFDRFHHEFQAAIEVKGVRRSIMCRNSALKRGS